MLLPSSGGRRVCQIAVTHKGEELPPNARKFMDSLKLFEPEQQ